MPSREHRGLDSRLCLGNRDPASESASAARARGRGPRTRADEGGSRGSVPHPGGEERVTLVTLSSLTNCQIDTIP